MERPYRDREWLTQKYHGEGLTQREIAEICGVATSTIRRNMKRMGIETREVAGENHGMYGKERSEEVKQRISEKLTGREFSDESIRRMSEAQLGQTLPDDVREKISDSLRGIPKPEETRRRMRRSKSGDVEKPDYSHWLQAAYNRGFKPAKREVHQRDEVCQICHHDGSNRTLEVHHIVPVRLFRDVDELEFADAHCLGNLVLLCRSCHPKVDWGPIKIEPDFDAIPEEHHEAFRGLWDAYTDWHNSNGDSGDQGE